MFFNTETKFLICEISFYIFFMFNLDYNVLESLYAMVLFSAFNFLNEFVREEVKKLDQRNITYLIRGLGFITFFIVTFSATIREISFSSIKLEKLSLRRLIVAIITNDFILKLFTVALKIIFTLLPMPLIDFKQRRQIYQLIESLSQAFRAMMTIKPWLIFLFNSFQGTEKTIGAIFISVYILVKGTDLYLRLKFVRQTVFQFLHLDGNGVIPTKDQLSKAGDICPICQANFRSPVILGK